MSNTVPVLSARDFADSIHCCSTNKITQIVFVNDNWATKTLWVVMTVALPVPYLTSLRSGNEFVVMLETIDYRCSVFKSLCHHFSGMHSWSEPQLLG